jgi:myo-inositol 2-dehydrogenase/D-chiro-inositol 1-dehydrogenase
MSHQEEVQKSSVPSRREFLKAAGAAAVGGLSIARGAHAAGKEIVKIGMIGCGGRCSGAASEALQAGEMVKLVAMTDFFKSRMEAKRKYFQATFPKQMMVDDDHACHGLDGYKRVIEAADVVLIACASKFHPMYSLAAVQAGKHVFVEKPHGIDPLGCRQMQEACDLAKKKNLSVVSGLQSRFHNGYQECIKRIHDGAIGDVVAAQSMFLRAPYGIVSRDPKLSELHYQFSNWYHFCWLSGDDVSQSLVHNLDRIAWIMKEEMPKWCFGLGGRSSSFGEVYGDMFDHHTAVYEYANGARIYALCRTQAGCYDNATDVILGTKGRCYLGECRIEGETKWRFEGKHNNPYLAEQKALIDSVLQGKPINSGFHMAQSTLFAVLGQLACYTGKPITFEEAAKSNFHFGPKPEEVTENMAPPTKPDETGNYPLPLPGITKLL